MTKEKRGDQPNIDEIEIDGEKEYQKFDKSHPKFGEQEGSQKDPYPNHKKLQSPNWDVENEISSDEKLVKKFRDQ